MRSGSVQATLTAVSKGQVALAAASYTVLLDRMPGNESLAYCSIVMIRAISITYKILNKT